MLTRISRIYLRFINFISTYEIRASVNTPGVGKELMWFSTNTKMMIKVQIMIQSLAQKAVCVSSVRPSIINFRETLLQTPNVLFGINNQILGNPISFQNQQRTERGNQRCNQLKILQIFSWYVGSLVLAPFWWTMVWWYWQYKELQRTVLLMAIVSERGSSSN